MPCGVARVFHSRKVLLVAKFDGLAGSPAKGGAVPGGDVQHQLPNTVSVLNRMGRRGLAIDVTQYLQQRIAMPGFAIKRAADLISETSTLGHLDAPSDMMLP